MQLGWAIWQHSDVFIEAEPHAVFDPDDGTPLIDCTPHTLPTGHVCKEILFVSNDSGSYDFNTTDVADNISVPLMNDPRVSQALKLMSEKIRLMNSVPGIDIVLPQDIAKKILELEYQAMSLMLAATQPRPTQRQLQKIGRNDPCPCNSGKKYKKCCGAAL
jgi:hypothetical protein